MGWQKCLITENSYRISVGQVLHADCFARTGRCTALAQTRRSRQNAACFRILPVRDASVPSERVVTLPVAHARARRFSEDGRPTLFGRDEDFRQLRLLLASNRLVSVVGTSGVGKTALAMSLIHSLRSERNDDVYLVDLAPVLEAEQLLPALVSALHIGIGALSARDALLAKLAGRTVLLVLDNCEHLLKPIADLLASLMSGLPGLRVLATSQEALKLHDEQVYRLSTLAIPAADATFDDARQMGALALFEDRARASDQRFKLTADNFVAATEICRQLDGIALAIELAAARVRLLGVDGLLSRLGQRLQLLTAGATDRPRRHQTLRAALEWSHGLLTPEQQRVFRRLGVMSGSFAIPAAQQVAGEAEAPEWETLETLAALVEKSLVVAEPLGGGEPRFRLLETMRHFALDRLNAADELMLARERHLGYFLALAESASKPLEGPQQGEWLRRLDLDRENLFAAHQFCDVAADGAVRGLRLVNALIRYWFNRGALLHGQRVYEEATARPGAGETGAHYAQGVLNAGRLYAFRGLDQNSAEQYHRAIAAARAAGSIAIIVEGLSRLGYARLGLNDRAGAREVMEQACALDTDVGRARIVAVSNLAELERIEGHFNAALPRYRECLALGRATGDRQGTMIALNNVSMCMLALGDWAGVRAHSLDSLVICDELDSRRGRLVVMEAAAGLAAELGQWHRAIRFDTATRFHTTEMGRRRDVADEALLAPRLDRARAALGAVNCGLAETEGQALSYETAVEDMRRWLAEVLSATGTSTQPNAVKRVTSLPRITEVQTTAIADGEERLTPRELEILSLIARGYDNRGISELLEISVLTVRTHRQRLMHKLGLRNAAEITAHAVKLGLYNPA